jgi:replicative DNA helicase
MLLSKDVTLVAIELCDPSDFYKTVHGHIFSAIQSLTQRDEAIDAITVTDELKRSGLGIDDSSIFVSLMANTPSIANGRHYATIVAEMAALRRLVSCAGEIADAAYASPEDVQATLDWAESLIFNIAQHRPTQAIQTWQEWMVDEVEALAKMQPHEVAGVPTGFTDLDALLGGLQPSNLVIVGARPSMGKSALALGICHQVATKQRLPVVLFSLEMSSKEIMMRLIGSETHTDTQRLRAGYGTETDWQRIDGALQKWGDIPFYVNDSPMVSVMDMRAQARRLKARGGLGLVVVDYLQLMSSPRTHRQENRVQEVSQISRGLKILARELDVPVVALSQLSRNLESRDDKRPMLSDLRESGSIEQDADVVMFLYREDAYRPDTPNNRAELIVAKHRNGPTSTVHLSFTAREAAFRNLAKREDREAQPW